VKERPTPQQKDGRPTVRSLPLATDASSASRVRIAASREDFEAAYRLVYRCYLERGYIAPLPNAIFYRLSYGVPTSRTVIGESANGKLIGTLTVVGDSRLGLPMESLFHREIDEIRARRRRISEVSGLCVEPARRSVSLATFFDLTRFLVQYAGWQAIDDLLISIHPAHLPFYRRQFQFTCFGSCRRYEALQGQPAIACRLDLRRIRETTDPAVYDAYFARAIDSREFRVPAISPPDHAYLCRLAGWLPDEDRGESGRAAA